MKKWLELTLVEYPFIELIFVWVGIGILALILNFIINLLLDYISEKKRIQVKLIRSISIGLSIPVVGVWLWYSSYNNPFNEFKLIINSRTAVGYINKAGQTSDIVEYNNDRSSKEVYSYYYEFSFYDTNGRAFTGFGTENGFIPEYLEDLNIRPHQVIVEYLPDDPGVNRVRGMPSSRKTIYEWLRFPILIGVLIFLVCIIIAIPIIKGGLKDYQNDLIHLKKLSNSNFKNE
jgi:hypothetical protein